MRVLLPLAALASAVLAAQTPVRQLAIVGATVQQFEDGPPIPAGHMFIPGEMVFFSFQVQGYTVPADQKVRLTYRVEVRDPEGTPVVETNSGKIETELTEKDKEWLPKIRHSFLLPLHALPAQYRIAAWAKDERSAQEAKAEAAFTVQGRAVEKSATLVVRNLRFLPSEEAREPLAAAVYRAGETLWARFDITGFKAGEKNRIDVTYGISILSPSGRVLFSEPQAALEQDAPFYPKRFVPGVASLNVQPGTTPGQYTLVIAVRDAVGGQTCESRAAFRIE